METHAKITMLGTGNAHCTRCYNTCFTLQNADGGILLVDAGGGNGILVQMERAGLRIEDVHDIFVTHAHTDHLLGVVWIVRMALEHDCRLNVWSHEKVLGLLDFVCRQILPHKATARLGDIVRFRRIEDGETFSVGCMGLQCFDIHSAKERQFGFTAVLSDGTRLCCLGDEPYNPLCRQYAQDVDWLMHEAFCTYADRERFQPYEKNHSTARDAGRNAQELRAKNLILYHTEDRTLETRSGRYANEAHEAFAGNIIVPDDLQIIPLD
ncbi:MAG: MBL fold metallo-hydrolase [Kiritimatiellae bacterium]|nr:MBL fold metallo-hydrolase [Kiritimatiellia bacterium]